MSTGRRSFLFGVAIISLAGLMVLAGRWGSASVYAHEARFLVNGAVDETALNVSRSELEAALAKDPHNPDYRDQMGLLLERQASASRRVASLNSQALEQYRTATQLRPAWPYSWSGIVRTKHLLNDQDDEFNVALRNAVELGAWEPGIHETVTRVGLERWRTLTPKLRELVLDTIGRGLRQAPRVTLDLARDMGRLSILCTNLNDQRVVRDYCRENL